MKGYIAIIMTVISLYVASSCMAAELGFRDIKLGMNKQEVTGLLKGYSEISVDYTNNEVIYFASEIKGTPVKIYPKYNNENLISLAVEFNRDGADKVYSALMSKYGKPSKKYTAKKQNGLGVKVNCLVADWKLKDGTIDFTEIGSSIEYGLAILTSTEGNKLLRDKEKADFQKPGF